MVELAKVVATNAKVISLQALRLSIQSDKPTHPKIPTESNPKTGRPDQVTGRWRVICSKNRLRRVGLGFPPKNPKKPDPTDVLRISSKKIPESGRNFQNPAGFSKFWQDFPDSGEIFQIPASNFQIPTSNFQILATNFHISATYQVDLLIFRPNLVKSHRI